MIFDYFATNFLTLMLLSALVVIMIVNRKLKIPATDFFYALVAVVLVLSVLDFFDDFLAGDYSLKPTFNPVFLRTLTDALIYVLRPVVILTELLVLLPKRRHRFFCLIPAFINAVVYLSALFGTKIAFYIDGEGWHAGALHFLVFAVQLLYVVLLVICSVHYFGRGNSKRSIIILMIVFMAVSDAVLEYLDILGSNSTAVASICVLLYYIYLASIYEQEMREIFEQKELHIARQELLLLRGQIQPDFIFNTLSIIRSLAKTDKRASASAIDNFSFYLRAHLNAIKDDSLVPFSWEMECVNAYLNLVGISESRSVELQSELNSEDFELPPLVLESAAQYCLAHGGGSDEKLVIQSEQNDKQTDILVSLAFSKKQRSRRSTAQKDLENAKKRLQMQCSGSIKTETNANNVLVSINIPKKDFTG